MDTLKPIEYALPGISQNNLLSTEGLLRALSDQWYLHLHLASQQHFLIRDHWSTKHHNCWAYLVIVHYNDAPLSHHDVVRPRFLFEWSAEIGAVHLCVLLPVFELKRNFSNLWNVLLFCQQFCWSLLHYFKNLRIWMNGYSPSTDEAKVSLFEESR